jgi:signal transduction histidine kinase
LHADFPAELPVYGDIDHLIRLFLNLCDNAVKYTPAGGLITVAAEQALDGARVTVQNSGPPIPPEHLPHLFDRFYRVDADRSSATGGSGLGLAIADEIVRLHGGRISVQSEPARGTTFTVYLPARHHRPASKGQSGLKNLASGECMDGSWLTCVGVEYFKIPVMLPEN